MSRVCKGAIAAILSGFGCAGAEYIQVPTPATSSTTSTSWDAVISDLGVIEDGVQWARVIGISDGAEMERRWADRFRDRARRAIPQLEAKFGGSEAMVRIRASLASNDAATVGEARRLLRDAMVSEFLAEEPPPDDGPEFPGWPGRSYHSFNRAESRAAFALFDLCSQQDEFRREKIVDIDQDGDGEFATMPELVGAWPLRRGRRDTVDGGPSSDFGEVGPWYLEKRGGWNWAMNPSGTAVREGYVCSLFLPSGGKESRWQGFAPRGGMLRGTASEDGISVALSESRWCAYVVPQRYAVDGKRAFFVHHTPVVNEHVPEYTTYLWCENEKGMAGDEWCDPDAALVGRGVMAAPAVDKVGMNGEKWNLLK